MVARAWIAEPSRRHTLLAFAAALLVTSALLLLRSAIVDDPLERLRVAEDGALEGTWHFPRGGPYILGFDAPGGSAVLVVDGRTVAAGRGKVLGRHVFQPGNYAVRFQSPTGGRLLWHPPGRRGDPEYVPPTSLSPEPPDSAKFDGAGASRTDGMIALGIVLSWLAAILFAARRSLRALDRRSVLAAAVIAALALGIRLYDLGGQGQTWDEDANWSAGRNYVTNLLSGDFSRESWQWNYEHPPVMKYVAGIGAQLSDGYGPARALSALLMALGCGLMVLIGERLYSREVGVFAGLFSALTPHLIAHGKVVGHEAPTFFLWTLGILLALGVFRSPAAPSRRELTGKLVVLGLVLGLAIFQRFANGLLGPLMVIILAVHAPEGRRRDTLIRSCLILPAVALVLGYLIWPKLWMSPLWGIEEAYLKLRKVHPTEPYLGTMTNTPPRTYFPVYAVATAPLALLVAAALWLGRAIHRRERSSLIVLAWLVIPFGVAASPVRQDGIRYIIPVLGAMNIAAAAGVSWAARSLVARGRWDRLVPALSGGAIALFLFLACVRIHPYYLDFYGVHVGGAGAVSEARRFETAWWGEGLEEGLEVLNREAAPGDKIYKRCIEPSHLAWMRGDLWNTEVAHPAQADWILVYAPQTRPCPIPPDFELFHQVSADGAPLVRLYRRTASL